MKEKEIVLRPQRSWAVAEPAFEFLQSKHGFRNRLVGSKALVEEHGFFMADRLQIVIWLCGWKISEVGKGHII